MGGLQRAVSAGEHKLTFSDHLLRRDKVALSDGWHFLEKAQKAEEGTHTRVDLLEKAVVRLERARRTAEERKFNVTMKEMSCAALTEKAGDADSVIGKAIELMKEAYAKLAISLRILPAEERNIFLTYARDYEGIYRLAAPQPPCKPRDPSLVIVANPLAPAVGFARKPVSEKAWAKYKAALAEFPKKRDEFMELLAKKCDAIAATPS